MSICTLGSLGARHTSRKVKAWQVQGCTGSNLGTRASANTTVLVLSLCMHNSYAVKQDTHILNVGPNVCITAWQTYKCKLTHIAWLFGGGAAWCSVSKAALAQ